MAWHAWCSHPDAKPPKGWKRRKDGRPWVATSAVRFTSAGVPWCRDRKGEMRHHGPEKGD